MPTRDWREQGAVGRGLDAIERSIGRQIAHDETKLLVMGNPGMNDDRLREQFLAQSGPRYIEPCAPDETAPFEVALTERCAALGIVVTKDMPEDSASAESARLARQDFVATINRHLP